MHKISAEKNNMHIFLFYFVYILALLVKEDMILWTNLILLQTGIFLLIKGYSFKKLVLISLPCILISAIYTLIYLRLPREVDYSHATELSFMMTSGKRNMIQLYWLGTESFLAFNITGMVAWFWCFFNPYLSNLWWGHHLVIFPSTVLITYVLMKLK